MIDWFDGQFEDGDVRKTASDLLHKAGEEGFTQETASKLADAYGGMCEMALMKAKSMLEEKNPTAPLIVQYLSKPLSLEETTNKMEAYYRYHAAFMDMMMTLLMIRTIEDLGHTKNPFSIDFKEGVQVNAEHAV